MGAELHVVVLLVKVKVTVPAVTPVTTPPFVTVATAALLLAHVPPLVGDKVVVAPIQTLLDPVMLTVGIAFTVTGAVAAEEQPDAVSVHPHLHGERVAIGHLGHPALQVLRRGTPRIAPPHPLRQPGRQRLEHKREQR